MPGNVGPLEIGIVVVIALLVFGAKRLPELGNGLGRGLREFKETVTGEKTDEDEADIEALDAVKDADAKEPDATPAATTQVANPADRARADRAG